MKQSDEAPKRATVLQNTLDKLLDREAVKNTGETANEKAKYFATMLGKLVWEELGNPSDTKLIFDKVFCLCIFTKNIRFTNVNNSKLEAE